MALTKEEKVDKYEIVGIYRIIQVRTTTVVKEDGVEISRSNHRHAIVPNSDVSKESADIKALVSHFHTDSIKAEYKKYTDAEIEKSKG
tara:strand:+ start:301 stop:564 length:264 start_codon:yes stop_codon:yes gene_type:complete